MSTIETTEIDLTAFMSGMKRAATAAAETMQKTMTAAISVFRLYSETANQPIVVAGMEARYYVRAAMAHRYEEPDALDVMVHMLLSGISNDTRWMTLGNRALVAAAAIRGWSTHRG